jgi:hypothetical protein
MKNKIIFIPGRSIKNNKYFEKPKPAKNFLPIWWKKTNFFEKNNNGELVVPPIPTFKGCMPLLDSLTTGYMAYTTQELYVSDKDGTTINWNNAPEPLLLRKTTTDGLPVPIGCSEAHFAWNFHYAIMLPKGYSALFTHPLNRYDLPFITSSGIVDEGVSWEGRFSFWIKENFNGIIPINTPIVQIIPFKTENWTSELRTDLIEYSEKKHNEKLNYFYGFYKKFIRKEKSFE